jgi:hypothetical protein
VNMQKKLVGRVIGVLRAAAPAAKRIVGGAR